MATRAIITAQVAVEEKAAAEEKVACNAVRAGAHPMIPIPILEYFITLTDEELAIVRQTVANETEQREAIICDRGRHTNERGQREAFICDRGREAAGREDRKAALACIMSIVCATTLVVLYTVYE
jgi:hypothetical protein